MYSIYMIYFKPNNKKYIGLTNQISARFSNHRSAKSKNVVHCAIRKYGLENVEFSIICENLSKEDAIELEKFYIEKYESTIDKNGYNIKCGGQTGNVLTGNAHIAWRNSIRLAMNKPSTKKILSEQKMGNKNPNFGKKISLETVEKIRITKKIKRSCMTPITMDNYFTFFSITEASIYVKNSEVGCGNIYNACSGKLKSAYGHTWKFAK